MSYQHGTDNGYSTHGCRCDPCKQARAEYLRQRRALSEAPSAIAMDGPTCRTCRKTEARCAYTHPCCPRCSHFTECEQPIRMGPVREPDRGKWGDSKCGTETGYSRHRRLNETACAPCRIAHNEASNRNKRTARRRNWQAS